MNERGCLLIVNLLNVAGIEDVTQRMDKLFEQLTLLSTQFEECVILLELFSDSVLSADAYDDSLRYTSVFCSRMSSLSLSLPIVVRYRYSQSMEESAEIIRNSVLEIEQRSHEKRRERVWVRELESNHCRFLSSFPSISAYTAQVLIDSQSLRSLVEMNLEELKLQYASAIPEKCLVSGK